MLKVLQNHSKNYSKMKLRMAQYVNQEYSNEAIVEKYRSMFAAVINSAPN